MRRLIAAGILVVGCGGSGKKSPETMPVASRDAGASCSGVADSMVTMMMAGKEGMGNADVRADEFRVLIRQRCEQDSWTAEAKQCLSEMKTQTDAQHCATLLTDEQQANLVRDQKAKFGAPEEGARKMSDPCDGGE